MEANIPAKDVEVGYILLQVACNVRVGHLVWGLGFRIWGSGFRVHGLGFGV